MGKFRTFHIKHEKGIGISIDTDVSRFETIELLVLGIFRHYRDRHPERLEELMQLLNAVYQGHQIISPPHPPKRKE